MNNKIRNLFSRFRLPLWRQESSSLIMQVAFLLGFLYLAVIDPAYRPAFVDTAKFSIASYLAMQINMLGK
jgi:hypothetical protein